MPDHWEGTSDQSLEDALADAHKNAAEQGMSGKKLEVKSIHVEGDNPIREYTVVLGPGG